MQNTAEADGNGISFTNQLPSGTINICLLINVRTKFVGCRKTREATRFYLASTSQRLSRGNLTLVTVGCIKVQMMEIRLQMR